MNHSNSSPSAADPELNNESASLSHSKSGRSGGAHDGSDYQQQLEGNKKGNGYQLNEGATFFKILVPSVAAGAIIGKGGETIAMLQQQTQTRIKMSKATDYFPGTNERVCIIYGGTPDGILQVHDFIAQKIREKPDPGAKPAVDYDTKQPAEREKQVKILVPNSTAGMIIGKGGNYIKHIKEESGAYVQISQKAKDHAITERCITVIGEFPANRKACALILAKIFEDPQSNTCPNLSYADILGPVPNYNPTGSPFANTIHGTGPQNHVDHPGMPYTNNPHHFLTSLRNTLRMSGYSEEATSEIIAAMTTLASYGILGLGLGLGGLGMGFMPPPMNNQAPSMDHSYIHSNGSTGLSSSPMGGSPGGYPDSMPSHGSASISPLRPNGQQHEIDTSHGHYDQQSQVSAYQQQNGRGEVWGNVKGGRWSGGMQQYGGGDSVVPNQEKTQISMEINESSVGSLLGRDGKNISEMQEITGAQIQLAPKKKFPQGRRTVTITGTPSAIHMAQTLIAQRLQLTEDKRGQNETLSTSPQQQQLPLSPSSQYS